MITVSNLNFKSRENIILSDINLSIKNNEILGIIGMTGSGKSSLLKILAGKEKKYKGSITVYDTALKSYHKTKMIKTIAYFDGSQPFNKDDTVMNFIQLSRLMQRGILHPLTDNDKESINSLIDLFGLDSVKNTKLKYLTDSYLVMTLLAYTFARDASFCFLDNPTIKLDLKSLIQFNKVINKSSVNKNKSIIIASNDLNFIAQTADRIIILNEGKIACEGPPDIITAELIKDYFNVDVLLSRNIYNGKPEVHFFPVN